MTASERRMYYAFHGEIDCNITTVAMNQQMLAILPLIPSAYRKVHGGSRLPGVIPD